jgi:hypothetical protein
LQLASGARAEASACVVAGRAIGQNGRIPNGIAVSGVIAGGAIDYDGVAASAEAM